MSAGRGTMRDVAGGGALAPTRRRPLPTGRQPWRHSDFAHARAARVRGDDALCTVVIDAEEAFDWQDAVHGTPYSTAGIPRLVQLTGLFAAHGIVPTYLVTYPVLVDAAAAAWLRQEHESGRCALGAQLHPWVTPPFGEGRGHRLSFAGNLPRGAEERKLRTLCDAFAVAFGFRPTIYRAGRYGLSPSTPRLLEALGFRIDTSIAPRTSFAAEGGPDFSAVDYGAFHFGEGEAILALPLCRSVVGWGGLTGATLHGLPPIPHAGRRTLRGLLAATRCAERITLSPEGNDLAEMGRLARGLIARGERVLGLSFHSSSMLPGANPYVRTEDDLRGFLERLAGALDMLAGLGVRFVEMGSIPSRLMPLPDP
ncbi:hypothetical protein GXW78_15270 [Roseomonas terrae]|jgi:hypothetical protein|uniref:WalW protein n=1 Tax=Neoroseomonas terrae TaxID=424799 RepID=A0ABS5EJ27_9PROT|nr:hypothetical protein [Neoroseomonas terrae]MBR0651032.1 hypothetical protein [Neoroseomonas terrae]